MTQTPRGTESTFRPGPCPEGLNSTPPVPLPRAFPRHGAAMDTLIAPPPSRLRTVTGAFVAVALLVSPLLAVLWLASPR